MSAVWYCDIDGKQIGPMSPYDLKALADAGKLQVSHLIWKEGMQNKVAARTVRGLFDGVAPPKPARWRRAIPWAAAALFGALALASVLLRSSGDTALPELRYLTSSGHDRQPSASPDGRMVAFSSDRDGRPRIWIKEPATGGEAPLTDGPDFSPRFSPDGSTILFVRGQTPDFSLYRVALVGGESRKLAENTQDADWSPDGRQIAFIRFSNEGGRNVSILF